MLHIGFYQLGEASVHDAVLMLVQKARGTGKKMLIYCPSPAATAIDDATTENYDGFSRSIDTDGEGDH